MKTRYLTPLAELAAQRVNARLTVAGAVRNDSPVGGLIFQHEIEKRENWTWPEWGKVLARLDSDKRSIDQYVRDERAKNVD